MERRVRRRASSPLRLWDGQPYPSGPLARTQAPLRAKHETRIAIHPYRWMRVTPRLRSRACGKSARRGRCDDIVQICIMAVVVALSDSHRGEAIHHRAARRAEGSLGLDSAEVAKIIADVAVDKKAADVVIAVTFLNSVTTANTRRWEPRSTSAPGDRSRVRVGQRYARSHRRSRATSSHSPPHPRSLWP